MYTLGVSHQRGGKAEIQANFKWNFPKKPTTKTIDDVAALLSKMTRLCEIEEDKMNGF